MTATEVASKHTNLAREPRRHTGLRVRVMPIMVTSVVVALAALLGWAAWDFYMGAPWTRDGTVRLMSSQWLRRLRGE
jgi:multidrug resistance efflux pump